MRNYMMERFLERISLSSYRDKFILKRGMLVAAMVGLDARSTMDLDATVKGASVSVEDVESMMAEYHRRSHRRWRHLPGEKHFGRSWTKRNIPASGSTMTTLFDGVRTPAEKRHLHRRRHHP